MRRSPRKPHDTAEKKATGCSRRASPTAALNGDPPTRASSVTPATVSPAANTSIKASPQTTNICHSRLNRGAAAAHGWAGDDGEHAGNLSFGDAGFPLIH